MCHCICSIPSLFGIITYIGHSYISKVYTKTTHCQLFYFYLKNALSINNISTPKCINKSPKKYNNQQIIHIRRRALKNNHLNLLLCLGELESHCAHIICATIDHEFLFFHFRGRISDEMCKEKDEKLGKISQNAQHIKS